MHVRHVHAVLDVHGSPDAAGSTLPAVEDMPATLRRDVEQLMGAGIDRASRPICGLSAAHRWRVRFEDGRSGFVKAATDDATAEWLATEALVLRSVDAAWAPRIEAEGTTEGRQLLVIQDLGRLYWPADFGTHVEWRDGDIETVLETLERVHATPAPEGLQPEDLDPRWRRLLEDPTAIVATGVASAQWVEHATEPIVAADGRADVAGDRLTHGDVRSDNIGIGDGTAVFVDWSTARRGDPRMDLAMFVPYAPLENAQIPQRYLADESLTPFVARHGGRLSERAITGKLPDGSHAPEMPPWLRRVFIRCLALTLDWLATGLDLPPRDGPTWQEVAP